MILHQSSEAIASNLKFLAGPLARDIHEDSLLYTFCYIHNPRRVHGEVIRSVFLKISSAKFLVS